MDKPNEEQNEQKEIQEQKPVETAEVNAENKQAQQVDSASIPAGESVDTDESSDDDSRKGKAEARGRRGGKPFSRKPARDEQVASEFMEKVVAINRITKVTKGGKKLSFSALVVVGDMKGKVGYSLSKASEVATAIRKAMGNAKKQMVQVPMRGATITHEIIGVCGGASVLLKPASEGTGVIAAGPVRAVCDGAGIHNILTKCHRSNNPINVVKATIDGLSRLKSTKL